MPRESEWLPPATSQGESVFKAVDLANDSTARVNDPVRNIWDQIVLMVSQVAIVLVGTISTVVFVPDSLIMEIPAAVTGFGHADFIVSRDSGTLALCPATLGSGKMSSVRAGMP